MVYGNDHRNSWRDLSQILEFEPSPPHLVIPIILSVVAAVKLAHGSEKGPCNLVPKQVLFRDDGAVELSHSPKFASDKTSVLGSSKYSAPEMANETVQAPDIALLESYVLGFIFYEILLGSKLFGEQFQDVTGHGEFGWLMWHADRTKRATPLCNLLSGFPFVLSNLIDGMMSKDTSERITDFDRIADTIGNASQATTLITNLSELRGERGSYVPLGMSVLQNIDKLWRKLINTTNYVLRKQLHRYRPARKHS